MRFVKTPCRLDSYAQVDDCFKCDRRLFLWRPLLRMTFRARQGRIRPFLQRGSRLLWLFLRLLEEPGWQRQGGRTQEGRASFVRQVQVAEWFDLPHPNVSCLEGHPGPHDAAGAGWRTADWGNPHLAVGQVFAEFEERRSVDMRKTYCVLRAA